MNKITEIPIIILARSSCRRFPSKHLALLGGKPMIVGIVENMKQFAPVILATGEDESNDALADAACNAGAGVFRGHQHVWFLVLQTAVAYGFTKWIIYSGDCPFVEHRILPLIANAMNSVDADCYSMELPFNGIEGVNVNGYHWRAWVSMGRMLRDKPAYEDNPWGLVDVSVVQTQHIIPAPWRNPRDTPVKASIDYPFEMAIANKIVEYCGGWPTSYDQIISAYSNIKEL